MKPIHNVRSIDVRARAIAADIRARAKDDLARIRSQYDEHRGAVARADDNKRCHNAEECAARTMGFLIAIEELEQSSNA